MLKIKNVVEGIRRGMTNMEVARKEKILTSTGAVDSKTVAAVRKLLIKD